MCNRKSSEPLRMWAAYRLAESGGGHVLARTLRSLGGNGKACRPQLPPPPPARNHPMTTAQIALRSPGLSPQTPAPVSRQ